MSLITRCPACGTMFKVVPDQLRVSDGWVRCGHCAEVFDATSHMQEDVPSVLDDAPDTPDAPVVQPPTVQPPPVPPAATSAADAEAEAEADESASGFFSSAVHTELPEGAEDDIPDSQQYHEHEHALREHILDQPFLLRRPDYEDEIVDAPLISQPAPIEPEPEPEPEPELHDLSFVRDARRKAYWGAPAVRAALALLFVLLAALLALQWAIHDRDRLAAAEPGLRPWLTGLCEPLGCKVGAPRQIESIAIDNSSFNKLRGDTYRLNVTLKNQAATESAMPALELTLTDAQDKAVIRRVLLPAEIAPGTAVIAPGADWSSAVALAVTPDPAASRIAGYRVIAFYP